MKKVKGKEIYYEAKGYWGKKMINPDLLVSLEQQEKWHKEQMKSNEEFLKVQKERNKLLEDLIDVIQKKM